MAIYSEEEDPNIKTWEDGLNPTKNISKFDFAIWNSKTESLVEVADTVYHYTTVVELVNDGGLKLGEDEELISVAELPIRLQKIISEAIELTK